MESTPINIGVNEWTGYDPLILADQLGIFKKNHVNVDVIRYSSAKEEMAAMKNGKLQGAGFTLDEVFSLINSGVKAKIVLIIDCSMGGDMVIGQQNIKTISDLTGKTIGYEGTVVGEFLLDRALSANHVRKSSVKLIDVHPENWLSAFKEKKVDALVCFNPVATILLDQERGNLLFSSANIPFEIIDVLIFSETFYNDNKSAMTKIVKTWFDALKYINTNIEKAADILASIKKIHPDDYRKGLKDLIAPDLEFNISVFHPESRKNIYKYSQVIINFMLSKGLLSKRMNTNDLFQPEILSAVHAINNKGDIK
jgi:NitT/TauT family transport system substrate-binding protein